jgi:hypothetical protein
MYCPRCSQEQVSVETKFCSRCGFPLGLVAEIIAYGGFLPQLAELGKEKKIFSRRNGLLFSLFWFMFFVLILAPLGSIGAARDDGFSEVMALLGTMGSLFFIVISFAFLKKQPKALDMPTQNMEMDAGNVKNFYQKNQTALPPQQSIPVSTYAPPAQANWRDTNDLVPSVTEGTTKLLKEDKE